jgi:hypothetical protein
LWSPIGVLKFFDPKVAQDRLISDARLAWIMASRWSFERDDKYAGLKSEWLGKTFEASHTGLGQFKVEGLQRSKKPIIVISYHQQNGEMKVSGISVAALVSVATKVEAAA